MHIFKPSQALEYIKPYLPENPVILEAGAFNGSDTLRMARFWPQATIHAFEPIAERFTQLQKAVAPYPNVHCYNYALSDATGNAPLYIAEQPARPGKPGQASSLRKPKERLKHSPITFPTTQMVQTITLDDWAEKYQIDHVDLLWLDIQGHELNALRAGITILKTVKAIHTEVGFIEAYEGQPLYPEVIEWLQSQGFKEIGRDFETTTDHFFGNILVIKKINKS